MTKSEQDACNLMFLEIVQNPNRKMVPSTKFNKEAPKGEMTVVIAIRDVCAAWKTFRETIEAKKTVRKKRGKQVAKTAKRLRRRS